MVNDVNQIALKAARDSALLRIKHGYNLTQPLEVFELASKLGVEIRFINLPSLEAMYVKEKEHFILISSLRPYVRQVFDCAHEIGHYYYRHGTKIDNISFEEENFDPIEFAANCFGAFLLMPKTLINYAFISRGWNIATCTDIQLFAVSCWLGVGYSTLVTHLKSSLHLLSSSRFNELSKSTLMEIKERVLSFSTSSALIIVDHKWENIAINAQVGDYIIVPKNVTNESNVVNRIKKSEDGEIYQACKPGIGRFVSEDHKWASYIRVSRLNYVGRYMFKHLEDPEYG